jgi:hypothetical protein
MAEFDLRPLENRVLDYIDNLRSISAQMIEAAKMIELAELDSGSIREGAKLYTLIADDLSKVYRGEKLAQFTVTGELPPADEPVLDIPEPEPVDFREALERLLNRYSAENGSGTPDFLLAEFLQDVLKSFNDIVERRAKWRGESVELPALSGWIVPEPVQDGFPDDRPDSYPDDSQSNGESHG